MTTDVEAIFHVIMARGVMSESWTRSRAEHYFDKLVTHAISRLPIVPFVVPGTKRTLNCAVQPYRSTRRFRRGPDRSMKIVKR